MSDLGGARQDISRHRRASESVVRQRKGVSGYGAPQIELHKLDPRGRRRHCDWNHTGESPETALLTRAQWRGGVRVVFVDFKPRVKFGKPKDAGRRRFGDRRETRWRRRRN